MSHLTDRADVRAYFSSMNPLASKIMGTLSSVKEKTGASWEEMEHEARDALYEAALIPGHVRNRYSSRWDEEDEEVEVFPKFISASTKKIIVDDTDGKTWEDEHSGQFSWETSSQLEMNLNDLDAAATPAVPRKSLESAGGATSPNGGAKPTPVRKARLVENWLDSPVLKAMQENSSSSHSDGSDDREHPSGPPSAEEPDILTKFGITFSLDAGGPSNETSTDEVFPSDRTVRPQKAMSPSSPTKRADVKRHSSSASRRASSRKSEAAISPPPPSAVASFVPERDEYSSHIAVRERNERDWTEQRRSRGKEREEDEDKGGETETTTVQTTTTTTTKDPETECDDVEMDFSASGNATSAVKTGFDFLDNW